MHHVSLEHLMNKGRERESRELHSIRNFTTDYDLEHIISSVPYFFNLCNRYKETYPLRIFFL